MEKKIEYRLRDKFLNSALDALDLMINQMDSDRSVQMQPHQRQMVDMLWPLISDVVKDSKQITPLDLRSKSTNEKLETLFAMVAEGHLTFDEAKSYMALISQGFEMSELIELNEKIERLEAIK